MTAMDPRPPLATVDRSRGECEEVIERGLATFVDVGRALADIRDGRLYRITHDTFEDYCQERWGFNDSRARQLIAAAETAHEIGTVTNVTVANEGQARALGPVLKQLGTEAAAEILEEQAATGKVTATGITEAAKRRADLLDPNLSGRVRIEPVPNHPPHVTNNSGNNEWYTPPQFIEAARAAMGSIDLDPASSVAAQEIVKASAFFTAEDDGLKQQWAGNVWLNPPYAARLMGEFIRKLDSEYAHPDGLVDQACVLVNNATETDWGQSLLDMASAVCFPRARIRYLDANRKVVGTPLQGQMVAYLGAGREGRNRFVQEFGRLGRVMFR